MITNRNLNPQTYRKIQAVEIGNDFCKVTRINEFSYDDLINNLDANKVIVKNIHVGINASEVNYTNAKYTPGIKPPFDIGMEGLGQIIAVGSNVTDKTVGTYVVYSYFGAFSEYVHIESSRAVPVPSSKPELLGLSVSGLTASLALSHVGHMTTGETVLVTAAAGGTGQFAVQLAKLAGNHVIGTCSSDDKVEMLKEMGCDRVINYKTEDFNAVLKKEYPRGVDIVYESVGGKFFDICLDNLASRGRLIVIGTVSTYTESGGLAGNNVNTMKLLATSRVVAGFYLLSYFEYAPAHMAKMVQYMHEGKLKVNVDNGGFKGLEQVGQAVEYLHAGKNKGKAYVTIAEDTKAKM
ncbi:hypothetical protein INT48_008225 [Thamnidium elegans]|uniref:Enoyl reductase (ER) domain-containing protein n=1 Tax=Thamnidium elegans TaxID=101142 RepID=A0A8H7SVC7_9FUNG|nr:hypothetical protein INT48_008225 [Thamnidium elegans]